MTRPDTFEEMARRVARAGAAWVCTAEANLLARCAAALRGEETGRAAEGARGLRIAARILEQLSPGAVGRPSFRPLGLRGAVLAGHCALAEGRPAQAELVGRGAAAAAPDSPAGLRLTGQALFAQGKFEEAVVALREALAVDPVDGVTRALHAEALWFTAQRDEAEAEFARLAAGEGEGARLAEALWFAARSGALDGAGAEGRP